MPLMLQTIHRVNANAYANANVKTNAAATPTQRLRERRRERMQRRTQRHERQYEATRGNERPRDLDVGPERNQRNLVERPGSSQRGVSNRV